eukprot:676187-Alexandrium_andersonii.AAC.1
MHQDAPWRWLPEDQVGPAIGQALPEECRQGWHILHRGLMDSNNEPVVARAADWIALHGRQIGLRAPTTAERAAATGMAAYMESLTLTDRE